MHEIKSLSDLEMMKECGIKKFLRSLLIEMEFASYGKFLILELPSDVHRLKDYCLTEGLTQGIPPEAIVRHGIGNDQFYEVMFLANNDFSFHVFLNHRIAETIEGWSRFLELYREPK